MTTTQREQQEIFWVFWYFVWFFSINRITKNRMNNLVYTFLLLLPSLLLSLTFPLTLLLHNNSRSNSNPIHSGWAHRTLEKTLRISLRKLTYKEYFIRIHSGWCRVKKEKRNSRFSASNKKQRDKSIKIWMSTSSSINSHCPRDHQSRGIILSNIPTITI